MARTVRKARDIDEEDAKADPEAPGEAIREGFPE